MKSSHSAVKQEGLLVGQEVWVMNFEGGGKGWLPSVYWRRKDALRAKRSWLRIMGKGYAADISKVRIK